MEWWAHASTARGPSVPLSSSTAWDRQPQPGCQFLFFSLSFRPKPNRPSSTKFSVRLSSASRVGTGTELDKPRARKTTLSAPSRCGEQESLHWARQASLLLHEGSRWFPREAGQRRRPQKKRKGKKGRKIHGTQIPSPADGLLEPSISQISLNLAANPARHLALMQVIVTAGPANPGPRSHSSSGRDGG